MATRPVLGPARDNVTIGASSRHTSAKSRHVEGLDERRSRVEAEGLAEAAKKESIAVRESLALARRELDKANARIARRDETITALRPRSGGTSSDLERRFSELVQEHKQSKQKYQTELETVTKRNAALATELEAAKARAAELEHVQGSTADLRKANVLAETENLKLKREVESLRGDRSAEHDPKNRLEALEVERDGVGAKLQETVEQTHRLEALLEAAAVAYRLLYRDSVPRQGLQRTRAVLAQERLESAAWRRRAEVAEQQVGELRSEVAQLREAIHLQREMGQMDREREVTMLASAERYEIAPLQSDPRLDHIDTLPLVDLVINHASLASSHYANEIHDLTSAFRCASADLSEITSSRDALHSSLSTLQVEHTKLQSLHAAVVAAHAPCDGLAAALRSDLQRANVSEARQRSLLHDTEEEVSALEERNRADRELLKRANDTAAWAKLAENALVDELKELKDALQDAAQYRPLYEDLMDEHEIMLSREAMAIDEAERVGQQNVELMGSVSGGQKIGYIDALRREAAAVKHELASTRHLLNSASDRIAKLEAENEAYKAVDPWAGSTRTKVRRQPEGSGLVNSALGRSRR
ncbi:hypothetical protein EHS25_009762 [Saitozyma podzolica]|uniref:Uncharacterized protein n=1 Tax=Saitozyma podzolica TaxID=1890683 RepID=A0A427YK41_9TREE|nr:hypothetical protein EHS25_009762 [Saitozyma podzolica]